MLNDIQMLNLKVKCFLGKLRFFFFFSRTIILFFVRKWDKFADFKNLIRLKWKWQLWHLLFCEDIIKKGALEQRNIWMNREDIYIVLQLLTYLLEMESASNCWNQSDCQRVMRRRYNYCKNPKWVCSIS